MPRKTRRLRSIENARDARLVRSCEGREQADEAAFSFVAMTINVHRAKDVAAVDEPGHGRSLECGSRSYRFCMSSSGTIIRKRQLRLPNSKLAFRYRLHGRASIAKPRRDLRERLLRLLA
jgi:hypothetical protein